MGICIYIYIYGYNMDGIGLAMGKTTTQKHIYIYIYILGNEWGDDNSRSTSKKLGLWTVTLCGKSPEEKFIQSQPGGTPRCLLHC